MTGTQGHRENEGLWAKLRGRKVVQWGIAYAAGSWAVLQGIGFLADTFDWTRHIQQLATIALLAGLPIVLVLAWYHGDRGQQRVTGAELAVLALLLLLGSGVLWFYGQRSQPTQDTAARPPAMPVAPDDRRSIAVLPFENRSRLEDDAFFVAGIHDDILTQLSKVSALKVISRTSVEQFQETRLPTKAIAEQLGVTNILEGGVQRAGERVRINVQLIDAATDTHLWAESYDRELTAANIFAIQSEVAAAIAEALKAALTPAELTRASTIPTRNLQAWEAYQLGRQRMASRTSAGLADSEEFMREAIDLDQNFALAYVGLADVLMLRQMYGGAPRETGVASAEQTVSRALELDPGLAEAWATSALIQADKRQVERAEQMFRRAIALNPNYATAYQWFSDLLGQLGRRAEALQYAQRALELDPLSAIINVNLAEQLVYAGRFRDAAARYRKAIEIDASMPVAYASIGILTAYALKRPADAVPLVEKAIELDPGNPSHVCSLVQIYRDLDDVELADRATERAMTRWPDYPCVRSAAAAGHLYRGDLAAALMGTQGEFDPGMALYVSSLAGLEEGEYESALARYRRAHPELFRKGPPAVDASNWRVAIEVVPLLQAAGHGDRARMLLDGSAATIRDLPRLGLKGYGVSDAQVSALRGRKGEALAQLRTAEQAGWRGPYWRWWLSRDPALASIRNEPEFKAVFAAIERDMARQRAEFAARPRDAPLELSASD
ncbi:MAG: tetratricopeptide repeat protein [Gammaproteobacteria bacterium]|nr:tetratricopeptide repeat protein [Gammaproteobacteria bacterium]